MSLSVTKLAYTIYSSLWTLIIKICKHFLIISNLRLGNIIQFSSVQSLSRVQLFANPRTTARQASLSITNSQSTPKLMLIESVIPSNHLMLSHPLLLLPSIFPSIRVFSNESALRIRRMKYWILLKDRQWNVNFSLISDPEKVYY